MVRKGGSEVDDEPPWLLSSISKNTISLFWFSNSKNQSGPSKNRVIPLFCNEANRLRNSKPFKIQRILIPFCIKSHLIRSKKRKKKKTILILLETSLFLEPLLVVFNQTGSLETEVSCFVIASLSLYHYWCGKIKDISEDSSGWRQRRPKKSKRVDWPGGLIITQRRKNRQRFFWSINA